MCNSCLRCGTTSATTYYYYPLDGGFLCQKCHDAVETARLSEIRDSITQPSDWEPYSAKDMSEIFWRELSVYAKNKNQESYSLLRTCLLWAYHADGALGNSFRHALDWVEKKWKKDIE